jgi:TP901 family phage tail tape measure protein
MAQKAKFDMLIAAKTTGQAAIKRMGNSMQGLQGRVKNLRNTIFTLNNAFKAMAVFLAAGTATRFVTGAINQADAFGKLSRQTGVAADTLQSYVNAGKLAGVEQTAIDKGLARLASSIREADQGVATYKDSFDALGLSVRDSQGNLKSTEQVFGEISDRFKDMPAGTTKAALAMELFSRQGRKLIPLLDEGSEALNKWNYQTSENFSQNAEYFNDQITMLGFGFDGFRKQLADALLPTLNELVGVFQEIFDSENDWTGLFKVIEVAIRSVAFAIMGAIALAKELIEFAKATKDVIGNWLKGDFTGMDEVKADWRAGFAERFKENKELFDSIIGGTENAPEQYFQDGENAANDLKETVKDVREEMEKSFGENMNAKLVAFSKTLNDMGSMVGDTIVRAFKGAEDALVNFVKTGKLDFKSLVDSILEDLARMAIRQSITKPLFNALSSALSGGFNGGNALSGASFPSTPGGLSWTDAINMPALEYSSGGYVNRPTLGMIGEGGESELVIPQSKLASAMARYQAGARGGAIVPGGNNANGGGGSGYAGGGNVTVNYQGDILNFEGQNYVKQSDVGGIISAAANAGEARTMKTLKNSRSQRAMVGL